LASYLVYKNLETLNAPPEFTVINSTKSFVSINAKWRDSQITIDNLIGTMVFTIEGEASMVFTIKYMSGKTDQRTLGYFTSGGKYQIQINENDVIVSGN
tara:strand:- start:1130 stop:1426 length:297 start_codon:yes stop_codon:yes gene_type:complete